MYRSANHDPTEFKDPERLDLERSPNRHYAFGAGIHRCLGSNFARAIFQVTLREFLRRIPKYEVVSSGRYVLACINAGYSEMRIAYPPGVRERSTRILASL